MKTLIFSALVALSLGFVSTEAVADCGNCGSEKSCAHKDHKEKESMHSASATAQGQNLVVKINGMSCSFCAEKVQKNFTARAEVKEATVNLETKEVSVILEEGQTLDETTVAQLITDAGFDFQGIK